MRAPFRLAWTEAPPVLLLVLLGLAAGTLRPAHAQYAEQTGADNPFEGVTATATPAALDAVAGDFDTDGDHDLLVYDGSAERFFANDGSGTFTETTGSANPFDGVSSAFKTRGRTFVRDVDLDGDLDLVTFQYAGNGNGVLLLVENTDGVRYTRQTGSNNPFDGIPVSGNQATVDAVMGDFGGNKAPDLLVYDGSTERYYENDGSGTFTEQTGTDNPFDGLSTAFWTNTTTLVRDFDGDGDVDLAFRDGTGDATAWQYREHTHSGFVPRSGSGNPLSDVAADATAKSLALAAADFDLDGHLDLLTYDNGTQRYYDGNGGGTFTEKTSNDHPFDEENADPGLQVQATTIVRDIEPDDDPDLVFTDGKNSALRFVERKNAALALTDGSASGLDFSGSVSPGTDNNPVGLFALSAGQSGAAFAEVTITNKRPGVAGINAAGLYWSSDQTLEPGSDPQLDKVDTDASSAPETITFNGFNQPIPTSARYAILAIDVQEGASAAVQFELKQEADLQTPGADLATVNGTSQSTFSARPLSNGTTALPVEMASFEGTTTADGIRLTWQTASEQNNAGFRVLRKDEEQNERGAWTKIGFVKGMGTIDQTQSYQFTDEDLPYAADSVSYRLRQVDTDGSATLTKPITIGRREPNQLQLMGTAPNPARQQVTVRYGIPESAAGTQVQMRLYDLLGRQVRSVKVRPVGGRHKTQMDVGGLASGTYVLRLLGVGQTVSRKLTVVR